MKKLLFTFLIGVTLFPLTSFAALGLGFGGFVTGVIPCTCSGGAIITFFPFFNQSRIPTIGALFYQPPFSFPYKHYLVGFPSTWEVGVYTPGVQAACLVGIPPACVPVPIPVFGMIQYMGTSL